MRHAFLHYKVYHELVAYKQQLQCAVAESSSSGRIDDLRFGLLFKKLSRKGSSATPRDQCHEHIVHYRGPRSNSSAQRGPSDCALQNGLLSTIMTR